MLTFERLHEVVKDLPVVDWHNHLDIRALAADAPLGSFYEAWVKPDPYKHRAMRICGVPERFVTGDAPEAEKWSAWMRTLPRLVGNPLFAWAEMEVAALGLDAAAYLHGRGENVPLADWTPSRLLRLFGVEYLSPCVVGQEGLGVLDGLEALDNLEPLAPLERTIPPAPPRTPAICPSLRLNAGEAVAVETLERFHSAGCRIVDVSVDDVSALGGSSFRSTVADERKLVPPVTDEQKFVPPVASLLDIAAFAAEHGWTMLLHLGALRETSSRLRAVAGPAGGFAGMRGAVDPAAVAAFLDALERRGALPRTILMPLNPAANASLAVLSGSFTGDGAPGKVTLGPAWWWCDHEEGMRDALEKCAAYGVLSTFAGMTTDSRSLLSFVRHGYFRRVLCRWVAEKVAAGSFPDDESLVIPLLESVCHGNAEKMVGCGEEGGAA